MLTLQMIPSRERVAGPPTSNSSSAGGSVAVAAAAGIASTTASDPWTKTISAASFASSSPRSHALIAFLVLIDGGKTVRVVYSNPGPKHVVSSRFPVQQFAFPSDAGCTDNSLCFTFILTNSNSERVYGHVMHTVTGEAYVCLSSYPWCGFFQHVMHLYRVNGPHEHGKRMIRHLIDCTDDRIPMPGQLFPFTMGGRRLQRPHDDVNPFLDCYPGALLSVFTTDQLLEIVASLLAERRVVIAGPTYGTVSSVILSLQALLAPFEWQHVLISVMPREVSTVLSSPTPYLIGLVDAQLPLLENNATIDSVVVVRLSCDARSLATSYHLVRCDAIHYFGGDGDGGYGALSMPNAGATSRIRWQLRLLRISTSRSIVPSPDANGSPSSAAASSSAAAVFGSTSRDATGYVYDDEACQHYQSSRRRPFDAVDVETSQVFAAYFAWLISGPVAAAVSRLQQPDKPPPFTEVAAGVTPHVSATASSAEVDQHIVPSQICDPGTRNTSGISSFLSEFCNSQCCAELVERCVAALTGIVSPRQQARGLAEGDRTGGSSPTDWHQSFFMREVIAARAHLFPEFMESLRAASSGGGFRLGQAKKKRAVDLQQRVRVRSLLCRTLRCCSMRVDESGGDDDDMTEMSPRRAPLASMTAVTAHAKHDGGGGAPKIIPALPDGLSSAM